MTGSMMELQLEADLRCEIDNCPLSIRTADGIAIVEVPNVAAGSALAGSRCHGVFDNDCRKRR